MQATLANWRSPPFNRWAFHHVRELIPTADIANDPAKVRPLAGRPTDLPPGFEDFLSETDTDGLAIVHRGKLVFERYASGMTDATPHILMSVSKSMLGLLAELLAQRRALDLGKLVSDVVPEVAATAYRGATIRHLLDMRAGIAWDENYLATTGPIIEYRKSMRYRSQWYVLDGDRGEKAAPLVFGMGIHGQNLFVDRVNGLVIAKRSSQAMPMDAPRLGLTMRGVSQVRKLLA